MSEQMMTEENKKTIVAFIAGLLIGGLLVYIFIDPSAKAPEKQSDNRSVDESAKSAEEDQTSNKNVPPNAPEPNETAVAAETRPVADTATLGVIEFPAESGWVGIRDFDNEQLTGLLGVARWDLANNLVPTEVPLLRSMIKGHTYAIVFYKDNGDKHFDLATDAQMETSVISFVAE